MKNPLALVYRTCAAGALALFLMANNAGASVVFRGSIDPDFGLGFTGLSYSGEALFNVADDCLNDPLQNGTHDPNADTCGGLTLLSASITLTNSVTLGTQTLTFWPDNSFPSDPILAYVIQNGTLGAVDTLDIGEQIVASSPDVGYSGPLWLRLFHTGVAGDGLTASATLLTGTCPDNCEEDGRQANTATVTITQVPEPSTVALLMLAVTAGWIVRRRRSNVT